MRYDDRLATVLRIRPASPAVARIQFQQLIDLLGTSPADARGELLDEAHVRLGELNARIPAAERAAALGLAGLRLRSPRLVAGLCAAEPMVASAAIRAADLEEAQWLDLIPALPAASRSLLRARQDFTPAVRALLARLGIGDAALPGGAVDAEPVAEVAATDTPAEAADDIDDTVIALPLPPVSTPTPASGIGAIVERIEAFRLARESAAAPSGIPANDLPQLPLGEQPSAAPPPLACIDFVTDAAGRIARCPARLAPLLVGTPLARTEPLRSLIRQRQPIRSVLLDLAGAAAIAGQWQVDAVPRFDSGRFTGYLGRLRRPAAAELPAAPAPATREAESLRQVLHELRTPVNAIQGFAEIIQHQLYGPTPHEYRALAAEIVADAARMLAGFEELERLARLQTGVIRPEPGACDFAAVAAAAVARLQPQVEARGAKLSLAGPGVPLFVALTQPEAERLCWRLIATLASAAASGEELILRLTGNTSAMELACPLPAALGGGPGHSLFSASAQAAAEDAASGSAGMFGTGFTLRLARAEARASGGSLVASPQSINLSLPVLPPPVLTSTVDQGDSDRQGNARQSTPAA